MQHEKNADGKETSDAKSADGQPSFVHSVAEIFHRHITYHANRRGKTKF